ncbi:hypothetical protein [Nocardia lijiangensis]|uniref:hypothetical protein n=1 Tax=Nocardia lijiangensis TaxID=299618 RepID=UPI003D71F580
MTPNNTWLLSGPWSARYQTTTDSPNCMVFQLAPVAAEPGPRTEIVAWHRVGEPGDSYVLADDGMTTLASPAAGSREPAPPAEHAVMPLALLAEHQRRWAVYLPSRITDDAGLFHHVADLGETVGERPSATVIGQVIERLPEFSAEIGSHECWYFTQDPSTEYEHKFTLPQSIDIYALTRKIADQIGSGRLAHLRPEFGNSFEMWQFDNYMFEVTGPTADDRGYASFIPRRAGGYVLKRKQFAADGFARLESKLRVPDYLTSTAQKRDFLTGLGLATVYLGQFLRTRFDVNVESTVTGHIYSVMADRCEFATPQSAPLQQLEIEYLRSRGTARECRAEIITELDDLKGWAADYLAAQQILASPGYLSKFTYLRSLVASEANS